MALDFTYQPPPPLQIPGIPAARQLSGGGSSGALTAIMAQRMKQKVAKQQAENIEAAQEQVIKLFKERDAVYEVPMTMVEAAGFAGHSRKTFEGMLQSEEFGRTAEQAEGEANLGFAAIPIPFFRPGVLAEASRILSNAGMSNDARDDWLKYISDGRHPNMAEGMAWFHEKAMDWKKSLYYGRPTSTTNVNIGERGLGNPEQQLKQASQGVTFEKGGLADVGVPSWVLSRQLGVEAPERSTMEMGMRGFYDPKVGRVEFESTLEGDVGKAQNDFAARLETIVNENPAMKHTFIDYFGTGGMGKSAKEGMLLHEYAQTRQVTEEGAVVPKPRFITRDEKGDAKPVDLDDFWED